MYKSRAVLIIALTNLLICSSAFAQTPEKISYQAVIRDAGGNLVTNQQTEMQISILQGSASGAAVYVETQNPTTNVNGLVSIEIGAGTVQSGDFATIDWANGIYFLKTETDPAGGTTYTITGTSQLLSVPYALHSKTAEIVTGEITETDPEFTNSVAANITATDITNLGNLSGVNTGDQDISGIAVNMRAIQDTASQIRADIPDVSGFISTETDPEFTNSVAANITATDITNLGNLSGVNTGDQDISGIAVNMRAIQDTASQIRTDIPTYSVGDFAQGGIVFWVDETGQHGLVCAKTNQSYSMRWHTGTNGRTAAYANGVYAGKANTMIIIVAQLFIGDDGQACAASACNRLSELYEGIRYGGWYLPSQYELELMYQNREIIDATATANGGNAFGGGVYWSSVEFSGYINNDHAGGYNFDTGLRTVNSKGETLKVRAIRAF